MPLPRPSSSSRRSPRPALALCSLALAAILTACSTAPATLDPEALIPKALTTCTDAPAVPPRPGPGLPRTDGDKADYVTGLQGAYADCKATVAAVQDRRARLDAQAAAAKPGLHIHLPHLGHAKPTSS